MGFEGVWSRSSGPSVEPVPLADVKDHLRLDTSDEDGYLGTLIETARDFVEVFLCRALNTQTWLLKLDEWPDDDIRLPRPPLSSVTSITYYDTAGVEQTWSSASYDVDTTSEPGRITRAYGEVWPAVRDMANAITVTYVAGYGADYTSVPSRIRLAIMQLVSHWYERREPVIDRAPTELPLHVRNLLWSAKIAEAA